MGYSYRNNGGIRDFQPDNTDTEFFLNGEYDGYTLSDIIDRAIEYFGIEKFDLDKVTITPEYIHTECLGYDRYDPGDYTKFIRISLEN